jgi:hypothetical protein
LKKLNSVFAAYQMISSELQTAGESIANAEVEGYCHVFCTRLIIIITDIWPRAETGEGALICAEMAVNLYRACPRRDFLDAMLAKECPVWHGFFAGGDIDGFADYLLRHKSKEELIGDNLRFRLLAKKDNQ